MPGTLYVVATPIGKLRDIALRALDALRHVEVIACEDTRHTGMLLHAHGIRTPMVSLHDHNERARAPELVEQMRSGGSVALVSDGGTPLISDPGWWLVQQALNEQLPVTWIPGATALIGALALSGLPVDRFAFEGFLPAKPGARRKKLAALKGEARTVVLYESPHRLLKALQDVRDVLGDVRVAAARELTKTFEEVRRGTVSELLAHFQQHPPRGEFVIVLSPQSIVHSHERHPS